MKASVESLASRLERELDGAVEREPGALSSYKVDGRVPALVCIPGDVEQLSAALRLCAEAGASVIPWGGGTSIALGNPPRSYDAALSLSRLDRLIEHDADNLTATAEAGMRLQPFQEMLARGGQFLPVDPPNPARATLGGIAAANVNGPRRLLYGGVRDLVLGMKMVLADGGRIKGGGKVVKNVAGYDICKLFVGSFGTLGIISEVTFRMAPVPESAATLVAWGALPRELEFLTEIRESRLLPASVALMSREAAAPPLEAAAVAVWTEGFQEAVERHLRDLERLAQKSGLVAQTLREGAHSGFWEKIRDFSADSGNVLYRLTLPPASLPEVVPTIDRWSADEGPRSWIGYADAGALWIKESAYPPNLAWLARLGALVEKHGGHVVVAAAPGALKEGIDIWGRNPPGFAIMRALKREFDPHALLNPGRFVAGI